MNYSFISQLKIIFQVVLFLVKTNEQQINQPTLDKKAGS